MTGEVELYASARRVLLDALDAMGAHRDSIVLVGAQAIYLHTGDAAVAVAPYTKDADLVIDVGVLRAAPTIGSAMQDAGFILTGQPGAWVKDDIPVDLMVPQALAGRKGRGADLGPHGTKVARQARGLEGAVVDRAKHAIRALEPSDPRVFIAQVAGPGALLVAKLHEIAERIDEPSRLHDKDSLDVLRLLRQIDVEVLLAGIRLLLRTPLSRDTTTEALRWVEDLFGSSTAAGTRAAVRALEGLEDPATVAASCVALAEELLDADLGSYSFIR
jgi:hypothetical protein